MDSSLPPASASSPQEPSPKKTYRLMAAMALFVMVLLGVAIYNLSRSPNKPARPTADLPSPTITATLRQNLPQFEYSQDGKTLRSQDFEGHWTLLNFWAYWCAPCLAELPSLNQLSQQWQGPELDVLTVNLDEPKSEHLDAAKSFLTDESIVLPTIFDGDAKRLKAAFAVDELPRHFLVNPQMQIVWQEKGAFQWNEARTRDQLMKVMEDSAEQQEDASQDDSKDEPDSNPDSEEAPAE